MYFSKSFLLLKVGETVWTAPANPNPEVEKIQYRGAKGC
jgi:hypothetical protein